MPSTARSTDAAVAALLFVAAMVAYVGTLTPGLAYLGGDATDLTVAAATLGVAHPSGYPLWTWIAYLFTRVVPVGDAAYRVNLMVATFGAGAVAMLYLVGHRLGIGRAPAAIAAVAFGASQTFWVQAVVAEVYAPSACMIALLLWLLLGWAERPTHGRFVAFAAALGLSLGLHLSTLGFAPAFTLFVLLVDPSILRRPRTIAAGFAAFLLGAAQFAWLPLRARVNDLYPNATPDTFALWWGYTFGAFGNLRFAVPWAAVPDRIAAYGRLLWGDFTPVGVLLGVVGAWTLGRRAVARFWLLFGMWLVHVVFFLGFAAPDIEVFFVPSHLLFALCLGAGLDAAAVAAGRLVRDARLAHAVAAAVGIVILVTAVQTRARSDRSRDTALVDYYENAFALLPHGSILVGPRGVFGADVAYFHRVRGLRPDVVVPAEQLGAPLPAGRPRYKTRLAGALGMPGGVLPPGAWYAPVLLGERHELVLFRVDEAPPPLVVRDAAPSVRVDRPLGAVTLLGYEPPTVTPRPAARVALRTYWRPGDAERAIVTTRVGGVTVESHELGLGNLARWRTDVGPIGDGVVVEDVAVVVPRAVARGEAGIEVAVVEAGEGTLIPRWVALGTVRVE